MTHSCTLMLASMIFVSHLGTFTLVMQDSLCVTVSSPHIEVSIIISRNGVELINGSILFCDSVRNQQSGRQRATDTSLEHIRKEWVVTYVIELILH